MNEKFENLINKLFENEKLSIIDYDKSFYENGLDSLGIVSFTMYFAKEFDDIEDYIFSDIDLTNTKIIDLKRIVNELYS